MPIFQHEGDESLYVHAPSRENVGLEAILHSQHTHPSISESPQNMGSPSQAPVMHRLKLGRFIGCVRTI
jgi:hypothetical protein